jgi:hypothetical protein
MIFHVTVVKNYNVFTILQRNINRAIKLIHFHVNSTIFTIEFNYVKNLHHETVFYQQPVV